ncbi:MULTISPECIES: hypothetical protein [Micromonospora]|uniref:hypothetical protein n=1 Tax=Micromonospora TaxID=1873 RepID=UPI000F5E97FD|nr:MULTISPECIES: hypothetical protein [Micromonospora]
MQIFGEAPDILSYFSDNQPVLDLLQSHGLAREDSGSIESDLKIGLMRASFVNEQALDRRGMTRGLLQALAALGRTFVRREAAAHALLILKPNDQAEVHNLVSETFDSIPSRTSEMSWIRKSALVARSEDRHAFSPAVCAEIYYQLLGLLCVVGRAPVAASLVCSLFADSSAVLHAKAAEENVLDGQARRLPQRHLDAVRRVMDLFELPKRASVLVSSALTHKSWTYSEDPTPRSATRKNSSLVLAALGSAVLSHEYALSAVIQACRQPPPAFKFQDLTQAHFVKSFELANLEPGALLSPSEERLGMREKMAAEFFKAVVGAVYLAKGRPDTLLADWPVEWAAIQVHIAPGGLRALSPIDALTKTLKTTQIDIELWRVEVEGPKHAERFRAYLTLKSAALAKSFTVEGSLTSGRDVLAKSSAAQIVLDALVADYEDLAEDAATPLVGFIRDHFRALTEKYDSGLVENRRASTSASDRRCYRYVAVEAYMPASVRHCESSSRVTGRPEAGLVSRYLDWLVGSGRRLVPRHRISIPGSKGYLFTDVFDALTFELIEAKSSASRNSVRLAIGQLLDYARFVSYRRLAVLLPSLPDDDLCDLLTSLGIACIYEAASGDFRRIDPEVP